MGCKNNSSPSHMCCFNVVLKYLKITKNFNLLRKARLRVTILSGEDLGFSRGGVRIFKKNFQKTCRHFFRSTELIFRALTKHRLVPVLAKFSAPQSNFLKKQAKNAFLGTFWKILTKKNRGFSARAPPSK